MQEIWAMSSIFLVCTCAGANFTVAAGMRETVTSFEGGDQNPIYIARTSWLVALLIFSVSGAAVITAELDSQFE